MLGICSMSCGSEIDSRTGIAKLDKEDVKCMKRLRWKQCP